MHPNDDVFNEQKKKSIDNWNLLASEYRQYLTEVTTIDVKSILNIIKKRNSIETTLTSQRNNTSVRGGTIDTYLSENGSHVSWLGIHFEKKQILHISLKNFSLKGMVFEKCKFESCYIESCNLTRIIFDNCTFQSLEVKDSNFKDSFLAKECLFENSLKFQKCNFSNEINISGSIIKNNFILKDSEINGHLNMRDTEIKNFVMDGSEVKSSANFSNSKYQKLCKFHNSAFNGSTLFRYCDFYHTPQFINSKLSDSINFEGAKFRSDFREEDKEAYRSLRNHFSSIKDSTQEGRFFGLQQTAIRKTTPYTLKFIFLWAVHRVAHVFNEQHLAYSQIYKKNLDTAKSKWIFAVLHTFNLDAAISYLYDLFSKYGQSIPRAGTSVFCHLVTFIFCLCIE